MFNQFQISKDKVNSSSIVDGVGMDFVLSFTSLGAGKDMVVCLHEVKSGVVGKAKPIDQMGLKSIVDEVCSGMPVDNWRDNNVIYHSDELLVWYRKPSNEPEKLWFRWSNQHIQVRAKLPTLVFFANKDGLFVFSACSSVVGRNTHLYHAPLANINDRGLLCFGSADRPDSKDSLSVRVQKYESGLLDTNFSHISCTKTFKSLVGNKHDTSDHIKCWQSFEKSGKRPSSKDLVAFNRTVEDLVKMLGV